MSEAGAYEFHMRRLRDKLIVARRLGSKATLDEWEVREVARMIRMNAEDYGSRDA